MLEAPGIQAAKTIVSYVSIHIGKCLTCVWAVHRPRRKRLDQRDVRANVPHRTLAHLLLRAEGAAVSANPAIQFSQVCAAVCFHGILNS